MKSRALWSLIATLALTSVAAAAGVSACNNPADPALVCADTQVVSGTDLTQFEFEVEEAGFYELLVVDLSTVNEMLAGPLDPLNWSMVQPGGTLTPIREADNGALSYFLEAGTYFAQVFAVLPAAAQNAMNGLRFGMYGISVRAVEVVPLPASLLLLVSGLAGLWLRGRKAAR